MLDVVFLAFALSVDAFAVAFSYGLIFKKRVLRNGLLLGAATGTGQFVFPIIGWLATGSVHRYIEAVDHWLAFSAFLVLGLNFIAGAIRGGDENSRLPERLSFKTLCVVGVATSIDACISGISLYFMPVNIIAASLVVGGVCFVCTLCGFCVSCCLKKLPTRLLQAAAGVILILLGSKVLYEHLS